MAQAQSGNKVRVHYTGRLDDGTVFDSSQGEEPLEFTIGGGQMLVGFEQEVVGMEPGQSKTIHLPVDLAYGPHSPERVIEVDRKEMPPNMPLELGVMVEGNRPGGGQMPFTVVAVTADKVTLDGNHPLAGKDLTFDLQLVEIA